MCGQAVSTRECSRPVSSFNVSMFSDAKADNHNTVNRPGFAKQVSKSFVRDPFDRKNERSVPAKSACEHATKPENPKQRTRKYERIV